MSLDLSAMVTTLWRSKVRVLLCAMIGAAAGLWFAVQIAEPRFRATAVVVLDTAPEQIVNFSDFVPSLGGDTSVVNTELEILRSASLMADVVAQNELSNDPEFNPILREATLFQRGRAFVETELNLPPQIAPPDNVAERRVRNTAIDLLSQSVSIRSVPDSLVFEITVDTSAPEKSAMLADSIAERYLIRQLETKYASTQKATEWLSTKVAELEIDLEAAEAQTNRFAAEMELINPETLAILTTELYSVRDRLDARRAAIDRGEATRTTRLKIDQLTQLEAELSAKISTQSEGIVALEQLEREAAATRQIYEYFLNRLKETSVQQGVQQADARLMSRALIPDSAATPKPLLSALMAGSLALLLGVAWVLGREARSATFRTADTLEATTGLPVMGQIPRIPSRRRNGVLNYIIKKRNSAAVEAIRDLRTSLVMSGHEGQPKVIMSTSSVPGEGKTTQTLALAHNLTGLGQRVLVIEGDIRRRVFRSYFGAKKDAGLMSVMSGSMTVEEAAWHHPELGVDILFGEKTNENAADVFSSRAFRRLLQACRRDYDVVLIDTPPVLLVPDARVIGQYADAILYTVRWDKTRERQVTTGLRAFQKVGLNVDGLVLSQVSPKGMKRYGYGQDYGTYAAAGYYDN